MFRSKKCLLIFFIYFITPDLSSAQSVAWQRSNRLHDGINYSYLEQTGTGNPGINYMNYLNWSLLPNVKTQIQLMQSMGFETLRLPVAFNNWEDGVAPYTIDSTRYFYAIDSILSWCYLYNMYLVIDYHNGNLYDYNFASELPRVIQLWKQIAARYATTDPDKVFFEFYNEPFNISTANWIAAADMFIDSIRPIIPNHTLIMGANNYNGLYEFYQMGVLPDTNIIYNFHFYEPMIFTHQGSYWSDPTTSTTLVPFPYNAATMPPINPLALPTIGWHPYDYYNYSTQGTCTALHNSLVLAKNWSQVHNVPIWCGEFGSYKLYAPPDGSRCRFTECVKDNLDLLGIPYALWDWGGWFSIFDGPPSWANLSPCMQNALDIIQTPLPVKLTYFDGYNDKERNILNWTTASEENNSYFEVERSFDAKKFESIGQVQGHGTTSIQHSYNFADEDAASGISYYQLKQVDNNGDQQFSSIILVSRKLSGTPRIYPNPANSFIHTSTNENLNWLICSADLGMEVMNEKNVNKVDISGLPRGMYVVKFYNEPGEFVSTQKFVKE
jgi:endoglucanase